MAQKTPFEEFSEIQNNLNRFIWSTELAVCLVQQKLLTEDVRKSKLSVNKLFPDIKCNAFKPPTNATFEVKYKRSASQFDEDLSKSLSFFCKLVIVRFHRALERYIRRRCELAGMDSTQTARFARYVRNGGSRDSLKELRSQNIVTLTAIPHDRMMDARIYAEVRHDLAHGDDDDTIDVVEGDWSDRRVFDRCRKNSAHNGKPVFERASPEEIRDAVRRVCGGARRKVEQTGQPPIFFYALFCFGAYRKLAEAIEGALPAVRRHKQG